MKGAPPALSPPQRRGGSAPGAAVGKSRTRAATSRMGRRRGASNFGRFLGRGATAADGVIEGVAGQRVNGDTKARSYRRAAGSLRGAIGTGDLFGHSSTLT